MNDFTPELGQAAFGQPYKTYEVPKIMTAALTSISYELERVYWNRHQKDIACPFGNNGSQDNYDSDVFSVHAYSWNEDEEQPWNFKFGDIEISWYKRCGRGMSSNKKITPDMASDILVACLEHLRSTEEKFDLDK